MDSSIVQDVGRFVRGGMGFIYGECRELGFQLFRRHSPLYELFDDMYEMRESRL